jgi:hypothetical protein
MQNDPFLKPLVLYQIDRFFTDIQKTTCASYMVEDLENLQAKIEAAFWKNYSISVYAQKLPRLIPLAKPHNLFVYERTIESAKNRRDYMWLYGDWFAKLQETFEAAARDDYNGDACRILEEAFSIGA